MLHKYDLSNKSVSVKLFKTINKENKTELEIKKRKEQKSKKGIFAIKKISSSNSISIKENSIEVNIVEKNLNQIKERENQNQIPKHNLNGTQYFLREFKPKELSGIPQWLFDNYHQNKGKKFNNNEKFMNSTDKAKSYYYNNSFKVNTNFRKKTNSNQINDLHNNLFENSNFESNDQNISISNKKSICIYCKKNYNTRYLKYEHLCPEKILSTNPILGDRCHNPHLTNICPVCHGSFSRSYFPKHYSKCIKEGIWCHACDKKINLLDLENHNKHFHEKKFKKKRKGKREWIRTKCEFCPKRVRLRNKYNHLIKCWGFRIFLANPKIFKIQNFKKPNIFKRNWIKNKWVKIPFKISKRVNIPKGYEIGCSYDLQGNKFVDFDEQQNLILPWIPEIAKPKNKRLLVYEFLQRKTLRMPERNSKEICEKIKLEVELEMLKRKFEIKYKNDTNNKCVYEKLVMNLNNQTKNKCQNTSLSDKKENKGKESKKYEKIYYQDNYDYNIVNDSDNDNEFEFSKTIQIIKCYEIFLRLKECIGKIQIDLNTFSLLPYTIQQKNISDKLQLEKELSKMQEINNFFNNTEDFQMKLREADTLDLETCFASDDEINCE